MGKYCATSDVKRTVGDNSSPPSVGFTSNVLPEVQTPVSAENSHTGVSTKYAPVGTKNAPHWYALRVTYGREKKAYDYLISKNVEAFYPTITNIKVIDGKRKIVEESRFPNIFFARGTEDEIKSFVYDNTNLPFLRFYYRHTHIGNKIVKELLIVPDSQMSSLKIICAADSDDVVVSTEEIVKFTTGQKVRITNGKFKGVIGTVARYQSQQRVGVVINGLLTMCTAYVPSAFLESVWE